MNWVSPIKDDKTLEDFKKLLKATDIKYYIMFEIGLGTGMQLQDILNIKVKDVLNKDSISVVIGTKKIKQVFNIPPSLKMIIKEYAADKSPSSFLIQGHASSLAPISREQAYRVLKTAGKQLGLASIGAQTMRKTFAWRYFKDTNDIYFLQNLFNHASPSITYRFIGEKPNVEITLAKMTPEENERSRYLLYQNNAGKNRLRGIINTLTDIDKNFDNPANNDAFYGKLDGLLNELEDILGVYKNTK